MEEHRSVTPIAEVASEGGKARAESLTQEERTEIAKKAADARWSVPRATHGSPDSPLRIGDIEIPCYVLEDNRRVIVQAGMIAALGMKKGGSSHKGGTRLAKFVSQDRINQYCRKGLVEGTQEPVKFRTRSGTLALGFEATILADICDAVLAARKAGRLTEKQQHIADRAELLVRGFSRVGIIALVDEATGFQEIRDRLALQEILDKYLRKEFAAWASQFPAEFYRQIFRLRGWEWKGMKVNRPQCVANYTKDLVYARLAPGILKELQARNPVQENGRRKSPMYWWLTEDVGHPALAQHLHAVVGLMKAADSWDQLMKMINRSFPRRGDYPLFKEWEDD